MFLLYKIESGKSVLVSVCAETQDLLKNKIILDRYCFSNLIIYSLATNTSRSAYKR